MYLVDYHLHSDFSFDAKEKMKVICEYALSLNIKDISITDHVELGAHINCNWMENIKAAFAELESLQKQFRGQLIIRKGIELGNAHLEKKTAEAIVTEYTGDFIIGSVHNINFDEDVGYYNYREKNIDRFMKEYLEKIKETVLYTDFDVLGHITYPLKAMSNQIRKLPELSDYKKEFCAIFEILAERKKGIEINTSGMRITLQQYLPDIELLRLYKECGGVYVTIGSDAHVSADVGKGIKGAAELLCKAGFDTVTTYSERKPILVSLESGERIR